MRALPIILLGGARIFAQTYPTVPLSTNAGNLKCGIRLYSATQVQTWCFTLPNPLKLVHNTISTVQQGNAIVLGFVQGSDQVLWIVSQLATPGNIQYQINSSGDPNRFQQGLLIGTAQIFGPQLAVAPVQRCLFFCCADAAVATSFNTICNLDMPPPNLPNEWLAMSHFTQMVVP